jgi:ATP-dependent exoDNAse (exonuclease V) beta subunit
LIQQTELKQFTWIPLPKFEHAVPQHTKYNHFYKTPDGQVFKSVTTMTGKTSPPSDGIARWKASVGQQVANYITNESMDDGTAAHGIFEKYLNNETIPEIALLTWGHFMQMKPLLDRIDNVSATEIALYSYEMKLAGMADCIAQYDGIDSVIDFKTSRKPKKEEWIENYFLQATIYAKMWNKLTGKNINQFAILISVRDPYMITQEFVGKPSDYESLLKERLEKFEEIGGYSS